MQIINRILVILALSLLPAAGYAQCMQVFAQQVHCGDASGCQQTVAVNTAYQASPGFYTSSFPVYCCSTTVPSSEEFDSCEEPGRAARIPKDAVMEAAAIEPLLIRNCAGGFDPYQDQVTVEFDVRHALARNKSIVLN